MAYIKTKKEYDRLRGRMLKFKGDYMNALEKGDMKCIDKLEKRRQRFKKLFKKFKRTNLK